MTNDVLALEEQLVPTTSWQRRFIFFRREMKPVDVHLDFVINGMPLRTRIQEWEGEDTPPGEVSLMMADRPDLAVQQIERLLGLRPHQDWNRGCLLFCKACWDEGCGGVTADIRRENRKVYWSHIGWVVSYEESTDRIENAVDFIFDETEYERVLLEARERFTDK